MRPNVPLKTGSEAQKKSVKDLTAEKNSKPPTKVRKEHGNSHTHHKTKHKHKNDGLKNRSTPGSEKLLEPLSKERSDVGKEESMDEGKIPEKPRKYSEALSRTALTKEPNLLQGAGTQKSTMALDVMSTGFKYSDRRLLKTAGANCYSRLNLSIPEKKKHIPSFSKGLKIAGKSLSFDSLKFAKGTRQLSKSLSVENGKNTLPNNLGVSSINKKTYGSIPENFLEEAGPVGYGWSALRSPTQVGYASQSIRYERRINTPQSIYTEREQMCSKKGDMNEDNSDADTPEHTNFRYGQNEERNSQFSKLETLVKNLKTTDITKDLAEPSWKKSPSEKKNINLCQCLHFHTEDGIKNIRLQMSQETNKFIQKINKANYFSKRDESIDEEPESDTEFVDKGTITENETGQSEPHKIPDYWKAFMAKTEELKTPKKTKAINKDKQKKKPIQEQSKYILKRKRTKSGNHMQIITKVKTPKKKDPKREESKIKNQEVINTPGLEKPTRSPRTPSEEKMEYQKALEELDVLELLFLKLNAVENALIKQKMVPKQKLIRESPAIKRLKEALSGSHDLSGVRYMETSKSLLPETDSEEFLRRRKNLKTAIIQHVRNWLLLDFNDN